jgi:hypothetical protein
VATRVFGRGFHRSWGADDCESGEDELEIALTLEASGVEKAGVEKSLCEHFLRDRLGDDGLSCPGEPVQQIGVKSRPERPLETTVPVAMSILGLLRIAEIVEDSCIACQG